MRRTLKAKVKDERHFIKVYLGVLNGILELSKTEMLILAELVYVYRQLDKAKIPIQFVEKELFSNRCREDIRQYISEEKEVSKAYFMSIMRGLVNKGMIIPTTNGYSLAVRLFPVEELIFKLEWES